MDSSGPCGNALFKPITNRWSIQMLHGVQRIYKAILVHEWDMVISSCMPDCIRDNPHHIDYTAIIIGNTMLWCYSKPIYGKDYK